MLSIPMFLAGIGEANLSRTLEQIRETTVFQDLTSIVWDNSDTIPLDSRKKSFFFGKCSNLQIMWENCYLSKVDMDISGEELDRSLLNEWIQRRGLETEWRQATA